MPAGWLRRTRCHKDKIVQLWSFGGRDALTACYVSHPGVRELGEEWFNLEISMKSLDRRLKPYPRPMVCGCAGKPQICRAASCHGLNCSLNHQWRYFAHRRMRQTLCSQEETTLGQKKRDNGTRAENGKTRSPTYLQLLGAHLSEWSGFARWPVACGGRSLYAPSLTHSCRPPTDYGLSDIGGIGCQSQVGELPRWVPTGQTKFSLPWWRNQGALTATSSLIPRWATIWKGMEQKGDIVTNSFWRNQGALTATNSLIPHWTTFCHIDVQVSYGSNVDGGVWETSGPFLWISIPQTLCLRSWSLRV